jgi:hypothetical protein
MTSQRQLLLLSSLLLLTLVGSAVPVGGGGASSGFIFDEDIAGIFAVPITVNVGLVGFNRDGFAGVDLSAETFQKNLYESLEMVTPHCIQNGRPLHVRYNLDYHVDHLADVEAVHALVAKHLVPAGEDDDGVPLFDVEVHDLEDELELIFERYYSKQDAPVSGSFVAAGADGVDKGPAVAAVPYTIVVMNLDKERMRPGSNYFYRYRHKGAAPMQLWLGRHRYIVVDISAGPVTFGSTESSGGAVFGDDLPSIEVATDKAPDLSVHSRAELTSLVISTVRHAVLTDVQYESVEYAEKLIVPIVVLRNHDRFDPFDPDVAHQEYHIDTAVLKSAIAKMLLPHQELILVTAVHPLDKHPLIYSGVFKALQGDTTHVAQPDGRFQPHTTHYLDSRVMFDEMVRSADELVTTLLERHGQDEGTLGFEEQYTGGRRHRILPVYVLSMLGLPEGVMLDRTHLAGALDSSAVLALQTEQAAVELPYFSEDTALSVDHRQVTRAIVASVATLLGGVTPPFDAYNPKLRRVESNYLFSHGHQPFGPFGASHELSQILVDAILRNAVLTRVSGALDATKNAAVAILNFTRDFSDMRREGGSFRGSAGPMSAVGTAASLLDAPHSWWYAPEAGKRVADLVTEVLGLEKLLAKLAALVGAYNLEEADTLSASIQGKARAFQHRVAKEVAETRKELHCYTKTYTRVHSSWVDAHSVSLQWVFVFLVACLLFFAVHTSIIDTLQKTRLAFSETFRLRRIKVRQN